VSSRQNRRSRPASAPNLFVWARPADELVVEAGLCLADLDDLPALALGQNREALADRVRTRVAEEHLRAVELTVSLVKLKLIGDRAGPDHADEEVPESSKGSLEWSLHAELVECPLALAVQGATIEPRTSVYDTRELLMV
jgi:hypothetical protein